MFLYTVSLFILLLYALFTLLLWRGWTRTETRSKATKDDEVPRIPVTVLIPVRNEEATLGPLLADLNTQRYPAELLSVYVVDDASTDATAEVVRQYQTKVTYALHLLEAPQTSDTASPKKRAITFALSQTQAPLVLCTDGDCRLGPNWVNEIVSFQAQTKARFISAAVRFTAPRTLWEHFMSIEFASLVGAGASTLAYGQPTMCNGANIAYLRSTFQEVGGYAHTPSIASGDDEFLMHRIHQGFPKSIRFLMSQEAVVETKPPASWAHFRAQRKRWASKWKHYSATAPKVVAIFVFLSNFLLIAHTSGWAFGAIDGYELGLLWLLKCLPETLFLVHVLLFLERSRSILYIPLLQVVYPLYVCFFGLAAQTPTYEWKGRKLQ